MALGMGYEGLWVLRGMLKIDLKNHGKIIENHRKIIIIGLQMKLLIVTERCQLNGFFSQSLSF